MKSKKIILNLIGGFLAVELIVFSTIIIYDKVTKKDLQAKTPIVRNQNMGEFNSEDIKKFNPPVEKKDEFEGQEKDSLKGKDSVQEKDSMQEKSKQNIKEDINLNVRREINGNIPPEIKEKIQKYMHEKSKELNGMTEEERRKFLEKNGGKIKIPSGEL